MNTMPSQKRASSTDTDCILTLPLSRSCLIEQEGYFLLYQGRRLQSLRKPYEKQRYWQSRKATSGRSQVMGRILYANDSAYLLGTPHAGVVSNIRYRAPIKLGLSFKTLIIFGFRLNSKCIDTRS